MARVTADKVQETKTKLLEAAKQTLLKQGYAGLSTRAVASEASVPMSQIQYHFGSKQGMVLALFEHLNAELIERQNILFSNPELKLSEKWILACDFLDDDLASGYVRTLHELWTAGFSDTEIGKVVREGVMVWQALLTRLATQSQERFGKLGPFDPDDVAALVGSAFIGAEAFLLLGLDDQTFPVRRSLRRLGHAIEILEGQKFGGE